MARATLLGLVLVAVAVAVAAEELQSDAPPLVRHEIPVDGTDLFSIVYLPEGVTPTANATSKLAARIVGGVDATQDEFKSIVLFRPGRYLCGGTLLDSTHVLTAAHCCSGVRARDMSVDAYEYNRCATGDQTTVKVTSFTMHPSYSSTNLHNDLCVLKLSSAVNGPFASLPGTRIDPQPNLNEPVDEVVVAGWGTTSYEGSAPCVLRKVHLQSRRCLDPALSFFGSSYAQYLTEDKHVCSYDNARNGAGDACQGDSGGPLYHSDKQTLVGVVSWGFECARRGYPGVYVNVHNYNSWIRSQLV